jgi:hypothetical protein
MHVALGHRRVTVLGGGGILQLIMTPILQNAALQVARARLGHPPGVACHNFRKFIYFDVQVDGEVECAFGR